MSSLRSLFTVTALLISTGLAAQTSRSGGYYKSIGNSWLGGTASINAALSTSITSTSLLATTRRARASLTGYVDARILQNTLRAAQLDFTAQNTVTSSTVMAPTQSATASFRLKLAGFTVWDRSVTTTGDLGGIPQRTYNLFPADVRAPVPVGPFTVTLGGNAGITLGAGALVILPTTAPEVRLMLSANTAAIGRAYVSVGVLGFGAGVELQARFAEQRLTVSLIANFVSGLSGMCGYEIQAMSLRLIAFLEALWTRVYSTTLTSWGSGWAGFDLLNL